MKNRATRGVFDYRPLFCRIIDRYGSTAEFARALELNESALLKTLGNGRGDFTPALMGKAAELLGITAGELNGFFFTELSGERTGRTDAKTGRVKTPPITA